jgi:hypothetical protein
VLGYEDLNDHDHLRRDPVHVCPPCARLIVTTFFLDTLNV